MSAFKCRLLIQNIRYFNVSAIYSARGSRFSYIKPENEVNQTVAAPPVNPPKTNQFAFQKPIEPSDINENVEKLSKPLKMTNVTYEKLENNDKRFGELMLSLRSKKERNRRSQVVLEGYRLIQDAINSGVKAHSIYFSQKDSFYRLKVPSDRNINFYKIPYKDIQLWSNVETSSGLIGVFNLPKEAELTTLETKDQYKFPLSVVCDNIRDPGNLGSIIRIAAAVGVKQILLTKGCVDVWDPKVLRSGAGCHFRVPIIQSVNWDNLENLINEEKAVVYLADNNIGHTYKKQIESEDYCDVNYSSDQPLVLILGGETEGLSDRAIHIGTSRLYIPLANSVESLNVNAAFSVIAFEMRRQREHKFYKDLSEIVHS